MMLTSSDRECTLTTTYDTASSTFAVWCSAHNWIVESLRGTNRNRRVATVRCLLCGHRRRHVWSDWKQRNPKVIPLDTP